MCNELKENTERQLNEITKCMNKIRISMKTNKEKEKKRISMKRQKL